MSKIIIDLDIINSLPLGRLDNHLFRRAMQFLVLSDDRGILPSITDLSWYLRVSENEIEDDIRKLISEGFLEIEKSYLAEIMHVTSSHKYHIKNHTHYHMTNNVTDNATNNMTDDATITENNNVISHDEKEIERKRKDAIRAKRYRDRKKALREQSQNNTLPITNENVELSKDNSVINNIKLNNNNNKITEFSSENSKLNNITPENNNTSVTENVTKKDSDEITFESFRWAKEEQNRAYTFWEYAKIYPTKNEFGRWIKDLRQFTEADISIDFMVAAIGIMRKENLRIKAPGSVFGIARDLKAKANLQEHEAPMTNEDYLSDIEWEGKDE